jgi:hypothetical protein
MAGAGSAEEKLGYRYWMRERIQNEADAIAFIQAKHRHSRAEVLSLRTDRLLRLELLLCCWK